MAKNRVQFQKGLSLIEFHQRYGTEEQCHEALVRWRWPQGFVCPDCGHRRSARLNTRRVWQCNRCKRQVSLTSGTLLADTKLPLRVWFLAIYLLTQSKNGRSALSLKRDLGVSYNTAWLLKHKLMQAMQDREAGRQLVGWVQMDDAYWGGERHDGRTGRGASGKQALVAAVQCSEAGHPERIRLDVVDGFTKKALSDWCQRHLAPDTVAVTDGLGCFGAVSDIEGCSHRPLRTGSGGGKCNHPALFWVNTVLGNVKSALRGTYHGPRIKHAQRYLAEFLLPLQSAIASARTRGSSGMRADAAATAALPARKGGCDSWVIRRGLGSWVSRDGGRMVEPSTPCRGKTGQCDHRALGRTEAERREV